MGYYSAIRKDAAAAAAKLLQSCPTLCDPIDGSPPGSPIPGILQARTLEWVAISSSNAWKWKVKVKSFSRIRPSATPWTTANQAPPSMGFSRQESWSGVPLPSLKKGWSLAICHTWIDLEGIMLSEISQTEKDRYCMMSVICGTNEAKQTEHTGAESSVVITRGEGGEGAESSG